MCVCIFIYLNNLVFWYYLCSLWGGSVLNLGTKKHRDKYFDGIDSVDYPGCFAMTELHHGMFLTICRLLFFKTQNAVFHYHKSFCIKCKILEIISFISCPSILFQTLTEQRNVGFIFCILRAFQIL